MEFQIFTTICEELLNKLKKKRSTYLFIHVSFSLKKSWTFSNIGKSSRSYPSYIYNPKTTIIKTLKINNTSLLLSDTLFITKCPWSSQQSFSVVDFSKSGPIYLVIMHKLNLLIRNNVAFTVFTFYCRNPRQLSFRISHILYSYFSFVSGII